MTPTEPVYNFVKGIGWVLSSSSNETRTTIVNGKRVVIHLRPPELGEFYSYITPYNTLHPDQNNGVFGWNKLFKWFKVNGEWSPYRCTIPQDPTKLFIVFEYPDGVTW